MWNENKKKKYKLEKNKKTQWKTICLNEQALHCPDCVLSKCKQFSRAIHVNI